jgi:hypothetical protein
MVVLIAVGAEVARRLPPPPHHATADHLRLAVPPPTASTSPSPATAMPPPTVQIVTSPKLEKREKREDRMRGEKRERTQREDKKGEDPRVEIFFSLARAPVGFDFLATGLWFRLFKTVDTKNESLFLVTVEIINRHHKKILGVSINHFSSSVLMATL